MPDYVLFGLGTIAGHGTALRTRFYSVFHGQRRRGAAFARAGLLSSRVGAVARR